MIKLKDILLEAKWEHDAAFQEITLWDRGITRRPLGHISYGLLAWDRIDMTSTGLSKGDKEFYKLVGKDPFIRNVVVDEYFRKKGYGIKLYDEMFKWLKKKGFKKVYSGRTRNSSAVDSIWNKYKSGSTKADGVTIYWKNL